MAEFRDLENATLYYTRIAEPYKDQYKDANAFPEYMISAVVSKEQFKEFVKRFPDKRTQPIDNDVFEEKYKTPPPFPNQDEQFVIKLKAKAFKASGEPIPEKYRPRVYRFTNGVQEDITTTLIGNGSKGVVRYSVYESPKTGKEMASLQSVLVTELVPYTPNDPNSFTPPQG